MKSSNVFLACLLIACLISSCAQNDAGKPIANDTLTEEQKHLPENALKGLTIADGLEVTPIATEPMLKNPTNIDVDEKGRIWVTEAYNYRPDINGNPVNEKGDRIIILEDTNGDGSADTAKVFYQGPEINAPLGICVLGNRVLFRKVLMYGLFMMIMGMIRPTVKKFCSRELAANSMIMECMLLLLGPMVNYISILVMKEKH